MGCDGDARGENDDFEGVSGSRYHSVRNHTPASRICLGMSEENIIASGTRKVNPPPRFIQGQRDIPQLDEWKLRKRTRKETDAATQVKRKTRERISVMVPPLDVNSDSSDSPLTELEDLPDGMDGMDGMDTDNQLDSAGTDTRKPLECSKPNKIGIPGEARPISEDECPGCKGRMVNLRHQVQQALLCRDRKTAVLEQELDTLQGENNRLRADIARLRASQRPSSTSDPAITRFSADELRAQKNEIRKLRRRLSGALDLFELIRPLGSCDDGFVASTGFMYQEMETLSNYVAYGADSLCRIRRRHFKGEMMSSDLIHLIDQTIITTELLASEPVSAFRALTFGFIQQRVFHAPEIWRDLHFDGLMTRQYQSIVDQRISPEALERYHRAAVHLTLTRNHEFRECFIPGYGEQLQLEFLNIMSPLAYTKSIDGRLKRQIRTLFSHALNLRASCYPHSGTRYQLVQFRPGHLYDPQIMRAEDESRAAVRVPADGRQRRIKACMHGLTKAYSVQEKAAGLSLIQELSQPFLLESDAEGQIISDKAAVILE